LKTRFGRTIRNWLVFLQFEDTLWPNHPVRFFSALSLEKNAPSDSASVMYLVEAVFL
jgi:hypothetical protein